jgi:hypothetical protein
MNPPPNSRTGVNVCSSPPTLMASMSTPSRAVALGGLKRQDRTVCVAVSSPTNSANVVGPGFTHVPGPISSLNVAGSQLSWATIAPA